MAFNVRFSHGLLARLAGRKPPAAPAGDGAGEGPGGGNPGPAPAAGAAAGGLGFGGGGPPPGAAALAGLAGLAGALGPAAGAGPGAGTEPPDAGAGPWPEDAGADEELARALAESERVGYFLFKREREEAAKVGALAAELIASEYMAPSAAPRCGPEQAACQACYLANPGDPLQCASQVDAFAQCAQAAT